MKTWWKVIICVFILVLIVIWCVLDNLKFYSVYYAKYTPHKEGVEPVLMMLMENLDSIDNPEIEGYTYDFDGGPAIVKNDEKKWYTFSVIHGDEKKYLYSEGNGASYFFDTEFLDLMITLQNSKKVDNEDEEIVKKKIYEFAQPIIDAQPTPSINLQWLFDWLYHDKFN